MNVLLLVILLGPVVDVHSQTGKYMYVLTVVYTFIPIRRNNLTISITFLSEVVEVNIGLDGRVRKYSNAG